jgi:hypothetical protein
VEIFLKTKQKTSSASMDYKYKLIKEKDMSDTKVLSPEQAKDMFKEALEGAVNSLNKDGDPWAVMVGFNAAMRKIPEDLLYGPLYK